MTAPSDGPSHRAIVRRYGELRRVAQCLQGLSAADAFPVVQDFLRRTCGFKVIEFLLPARRCVGFGEGNVGVARRGAGDSPSQEVICSFALPDGSAGMLRAEYEDDACRASRPSELDYFTVACLAEFLERVPSSSQAPAGALRELVGATRAMRRLCGLVEAYARCDLPKLILGERGTGKGMVARVMHGLRGGGEDTLFPVSCAAVPQALAESELFGHRKGAFTDAVRDRDGLLLAAFRVGGTILLDEIAECAPGIQPKLLQAVEEGTFRPVGADHTVSVRRDGRLGIGIYATTQREALPKLRPDLRDRLSAGVVELPPLRDRLPDVLLLADRRLAQRGAATGVAKSLNDNGRLVLLGCDWPGNVRQLFNVLDRALVLAGENATVEAAVLELCLEAERGLQARSGYAAPLAGDGASRATQPFMTLREMETAHIKAALDVAGNVTGAAQLLGLKRTTLHSRLRALHLTGRW